VFEEFHFIDALSPFNGIGAVLNARYVFNAWVKLLFATGTLPILIGDRAAMLRDPLVHGVGKLTSSPVINASRARPPERRPHGCERQPLRDLR
jgi:hypothetical protein